MKPHDTFAQELAAGHAPTHPQLQVHVVAADPVRRADLAARVALAGHQVQDAATDEASTTSNPIADLVLSDAATPVVLGVPVLRMGPGAALPTNLSPIQLDAALRAAAVGLGVSLRPFDAAPEIRPQLTPRELDILRCLAEGLSNKAAARRLAISAHTVKFHLEAVFAKLGANSRTNAVATGLRSGLIVL